MNDQEIRAEALKIAINEIAAYKESILTEGHTERLVASAHAVFEYIKKGAIPN
jgi:hypothetical protein